MNSARLRAALAALAAALALAGAPARADGTLRLARFAVEARDGRLAAAVDLSPALGSADLRKLLSNGLTNVMLLQIALVPEHGSDPAGAEVRELDVLYDVWDETWGVTVRDPGAPGGRARTFRAFDDLRAFLADARGLDLGPVAALGTGSWVVQARIEFNPVSKELLERTRALLANSAATGRSGTPSRSVLGAMASYLLRAADPGAVVVVLRSAPFTAHEVAR